MHSLQTSAPAVSARLCSALLVFGAVASWAAAQEGWNDTPPEFPNLWIGSNAIAVEDLQGKAALLYFFEETCPKCKGYWPELMALASRYADKPIAFVAINSGTAAGQVVQYARSVRLNWPVIVDVDRSYEKACNVGEISTQNIVQVSYITADGKIQRGNFRKLEDTIERALKGASWNIDPAEMPPEVWPVWRSIEFAQYPPVAGALAKAKGSRKPEVKAAAAKLGELVDSKGAEALAAAKEEEAASKYRAHEKYVAIAARFDGYPAGVEAEAEGRKLARDPQLRQELKAIQLVERQRLLVSSPKASVRERAIATIKKLISEQPDSEAARVGASILEVQPIFEVN